jgi:hypothetical protein
MTQPLKLTCLLYVAGPPLWSSGQNSWLQIQRSGFNSRRYQIFWEVMDLERGPLSLVSTIEELLGRKSSGSGLENREYGRRDPSRWPRDSFYPPKLAPTSPTGGGRSIGIVPSRTQATEFFLYIIKETNHQQLPSTRLTSNLNDKIKLGLAAFRNWPWTYSARVAVPTLWAFWSNLSLRAWPQETSWRAMNLEYYSFNALSLGYLTNELTLWTILMLGECILLLIYPMKLNNHVPLQQPLSHV